MSKKKLNTEGISNELEGASLFFTPKSPATPLETVPEPRPVHVPTKIQTPEQPQASSINANDENIKTKSYNVQASERASMHASMISINQDDHIKTIRNTVKQVGKEILYIRLTTDEKHALSSIVTGFNEMYRGEGYKTSENEVSRIGLNYLLEDHHENGNNSILAQALAALIA